MPFERRRKPEGKVAFPQPHSNRRPRPPRGEQAWALVEVSGLDRPGLLYELTATLSKLNLNIASAHVATFGERVVDGFYVTDLLGAQIVSPTRRAAIKRALIQLLAGTGEGAAARVE